MDMAPLGQAVYDDSGRPPTSDDLALVQAVSEQVALALESARLFAQTQLALAETQARQQRERILREVTARVRSSTDPDMIMRILARELSTVLDRPTIVHLNIDADQAKVQARMPGGQAMSEGDN